MEKDDKTKDIRIEQLEQELDLYRKILSSLPVGIQVFDKNGTSYTLCGKQQYQTAILPATLVRPVITI